MPLVSPADATDNSGVITVSEDTNLLNFKSGEPSSKIISQLQSMNPSQLQYSESAVHEGSAGQDKPKFVGEHSNLSFDGVLDGAAGRQPSKENTLLSFEEDISEILQPEDLAR